jgi:UDP:flavonoid glycosyltransferase YjiC (YdhE family)
LTDNNFKQILISPLDWGLGHTTRCVPIIAYLQQLGHHVVFAGNDWQRSFITESFPGIETIHLDGYNVNYSRRGSAFMLNVFAQLPGLLRAIRKEREWLNDIVAKRDFHGIISDNRYGLHHPAVPSAFMTHQLRAQSGFGNLTDGMVMKLHYRHISKFNDNWVIDVPGVPNLGGRLSHPLTLPPGARYMGLLSQVAEETAKPDGEQHLLVLLSGPEPQRTMLSELLWKQALKYNGSLVFVEGSAKAVNHSHIPSHIIHHSRVTKEILTGLIRNAHLVICRSGYSTLMDLVALDKKAILIPTPGQTEQEYLGKHLHKEGVFMAASQKEFDLEKALFRSKQFPFVKLDLPNAFQRHRQVLENWINNLG